ncbi:MAG: inorganic phosphate transporter [Verrucomicrobiales bacterium]|nr:inorganic phosphate transporter [Verrucomicrobiales bacterium]
MFLLAAMTMEPTTTWIVLILALALALGFEFVNGFHDTANAVATVIYTHALPPNVAVVWSGIWNLLGVLFSSGTVAFGVVALLPVELVLNVESASGYAMVFALLVSAIVWNLGTWSLGLPASSSHTLIGSILGVAFANAMLHHESFGHGVNWAQAREVGLSLLVSPIVGFLGAGSLLLLLKRLVRNAALFAAPQPGVTPPFWIRSILVFTCTGVSFAHGSNDGQKGMGLVMLILVGILPGSYALRMNETPEEVRSVAVVAGEAGSAFARLAGNVRLEGSEARRELSSFLKPGEVLQDQTYAALAAGCRELSITLGGVSTFRDLSEALRREVRSEAYLIGGSLAKLERSGKIPDPELSRVARSLRKQLDGATEYIPLWVKVAIAVALGLGTTVGWKRIVVTVGEKIGKSHLSYGQGASAEVVAMGTILAADSLGLPVSTTHVLSSGVAGTMAANRSGLQSATLRNILLAWVLTLPVCVFLGAVLFAFGNYFLLHALGMK